MPSDHPTYVFLKPMQPELVKLGACRSTYDIDDSYELERLHCTAVRLGSERDRSIAEWQRVHAALAAFAMAPFDITLDTLDGTLLRGAKGSTGAARFHRALVRHLGAADIALPTQGFWLHMSLAYRGYNHPRTAIDPITWRVEQFLLVRSVPASIHAAGRHEILGCWPLADRQLSLAL